jgi:hypothetical protein
MISTSCVHFPFVVMFWKWQLFQKNASPKRLSFQVSISDRVIINRWIPWYGCFDGIKSSACF